MDLEINYIQPKSSGDADYFIYRHLAVSEQGFPGAETLFTPSSSQHGISCLSMMDLTSYCEKELTTYGDGLKIIKPSEQEVLLCVEANSLRCHTSTSSPLEDGWVQVAACNNVGCSDWSNAMTVPESGFAITFLLMCLFMAMLAKLHKDIS